MDPLRSTPSLHLPRTLGPKAQEQAAEPDGPPLDGYTPGVRPGEPAPDLDDLPELIHPGTGLEFRPVLDETLGRLPFLLIRAIAAQGYRLHVVDSTGELPVTLELEPGDRLWGEQKISTAAWELITTPLRTKVAGMVYNGAVPGLRGNGLRIVLWDNVFRRGDGLADWYVLHELGHCTDFSFAFLFPDRWRAWTARLAAAFDKSPRFLTRYASESPVEYFAEGFAAWATPPGHEREGQATEGMELERWELDREVLAAEDPTLHALIEEAVYEVSAP